MPELTTDNANSHAVAAKDAAKKAAKSAKGASAKMGEAAQQVAGRTTDAVSNSGTRERSIVGGVGVLVVVAVVCAIIWRRNH